MSRKLKYKDYSGVYYVDDGQVKYNSDGYLTPPRRFKQDYKLYFQVSKMIQGKRTYKKQTITYPHDMSLKSAFEDAQDKKKLLLTTIDNKKTYTPTDEAETPLNVLFDKYLLQKKTELKTRTYEFYRNFYDVHIKQPIGNKVLKDITKQDLELIAYKMRADGRAERTVLSIKQVLRPLFNKYLIDGVIQVNPALQLEIGKLDNEVEISLTSEDIKNLMKCIYDYPFEPCRGVFVFLTTGRRLNEVLTLRWEHISIKDEIYKIDKENAKNSKTNIYPLTAELIEALPTPKKRGYIFHAIKDTSKPLNRATVVRHWKQIVSDAGIEHLRIHDLRHIIGNTLVSNGSTLEEVAALLGHSSTAVTRRYSKAETFSKENTLNKFMELVK